MVCSPEISKYTLEYRPTNRKTPLKFCLQTLLLFHNFQVKQIQELLQDFKDSQEIKQPVKS